MPDDFQHRYGYCPLLAETFVETDRHQGTSLAAANWVCVGQTAGPGRCATRGGTTSSAARRWAMYA